jgi:hypothetical protein
MGSLNLLILFGIGKKKLNSRQSRSDREISLDEFMLGWQGRLCVTQAKLQSMAYWYGWFVKVQLDIFVTCRFMMADVDL